MTKSGRGTEMARDAGKVVITGFMGTGKSLVGRALADMLGMDFVDTDSAIEEETGMSVADLFARHGERAFRERERALCERLAGAGGVVIATGGGTLIDPQNLKRFSDAAALVLLEADLDVIAERVQGDERRPLLAADDKGKPLRERIERILAERASVYDRIPLRIDTSTATPVEAAARIAARLHLPASTMTLSFGGAADRDGEVPRGRYGAARIDIGRGALARLGRYLHDYGLDTHAFLLVPKNLQELYLEQLAAVLNDASIPFTTVTVRDGDEHKHMEQVRELFDTLLERGAKRDSTIVAFGGGVTGDIAGFLASMFMRGIPHVQIPTTVLAQVDASLGGKVGVNHPQAKNLIGAFYQPHLILDDPSVFRTLPMEEISNGMAEVVKSAIIRSEPFFEYLEKQMADDATVRLRDLGFLERCVLEAARIKTEVCNTDPFERDIRRWMNLGHTLGHALETSGHYRGLKHGEAVSVGIIAALRIAVARGRAEPGLLERTRRVLEWCGLPVGVDRFDREALIGSMSLDKKIKKGRLHFVLPVRLGQCEVIDDVTAEEIVSTLEKG